MTMLKNYFLVLPGLVMAMVASAHAPLPSPGWCDARSVKVVTIATFKFTNVDVVNFSECLRSGKCLDIAARVGTCTPNRDCGETHDDWGAANRMARHYCGLFQGPATSLHPDIGSVTINVTSPHSFNFATHHSSYSASAGLVGQCLRCEPVN